MKKAKLLSIAILLLVLIGLPLAPLMQSYGSTSTGLNSSLPAGVSLLCTLYSGAVTTGIIKTGGGAAFVEDYTTGNLYSCASGHETGLVAGPGDDGYYAMAGTTTSLGTFIALVKEPTSSHAFTQDWFCIGAGVSQGSAGLCRLTSGPYDNVLCEPSSGCAPNSSPSGVAFDSKLNIYYADYNKQGDVNECTWATGYAFCFLFEYLGSAGGIPGSIFIDSSGNVWVSDISCHGYIWENGVLKYTLNNDLGAITMSSANHEKMPHLYVGVDGDCNGSVASILDVSTGHYLPTPFTGPAQIPGLSTSLQFTSLGPNVYKTTDSS